MQCLVLVLIFLEAQAFLSMTKAALALLILAVTSLSVAPLSVNGTSKVEGIHLPDGLSPDCDWCVGSGVDLHQLSFPVDHKPCPSRYGLQVGGLVLHLAVAV